MSSSFLFLVLASLFASASSAFSGSLRLMPRPGEAANERAAHPTIFEPLNFVFGILFAVLGTIIGLELLTRVGIAPNSSIIAAVATIALARVPMSLFRRFRDLARQNLMQTVISAATFGGANGILLPVGVLWLMGRRELVPAMMLGAVAGVLIDATILYRLFDTRLFPASGLWPSGVATAECLLAGDRGGGRAALLVAGGLAGILGHFAGAPMDVFGVCWIGNIWALLMFGLGLLARGYAGPLVHVDVEGLYLPHGFMIGAGIVALAQIVVSVRRTKTAPNERGLGNREGPILVRGFAVYALAALVMALVAGIAFDMSLASLVGFVLFAATAALVSELIVGIAAMHSGWFPAFATALIFLLLGMALGFPALPLAFLVGFTASTGPAFADMGYDLKAGWILRGNGADPAFEREGRRAQYQAELLGIAVSALAVLFFYRSYFERDLVSTLGPGRLGHHRRGRESVPGEGAGPVGDPRWRPPGPRRAGETARCPVRDRAPHRLPGRRVDGHGLARHPVRVDASLRDGGRSADVRSRRRLHRRERDRELRRRDLAPGLKESAIRTGGEPFLERERGGCGPFVSHEIELPPRVRNGRELARSHPPEGEVTPGPTDRASRCLR